ncbi:glycoprotein 3-alpha-L-fucosyltransferase A-like [Macrosteles quadrilineatus]|uniref:glycoprotein 3-alpha-L-fucosyltransferase A-like n=1 Tax=Macrosteles quadrilineatus TaxID=74068 RepID=UPI0023E0C481|nr:glycoprotein 3-alpha-L-fucosyltransferase A-like [Macrosteles quadrilineatus]
MDHHKSIFNPRNLIICVTTCTIAIVWAVILVTVYFYFFGGPYTTVIHNVTEVERVQMVRQELLPWYLGGPVLPTTCQDDDIVPLFGITPPLTQLDRLRSQLMFLPQGNSEMKIVLFWSDWLPAETDEYKILQCPIKSCVFTNSRKLYEKASAVVFRNPSKLLKDFPEEYRPRSQVWVFNSLSAPQYEFAHPRDVFNWTATPRLDSTVPMFPHGVWMYYNPVWRHQDPSVNKVGHKLLEAAAWFPSSCDVRSRAYRYISLLSHYTLVDTFSSHPSCTQMEVVDQCPQGRWDICLKLLRDKYRVTLVLDTTMCNNTIPDMFYLALQANTVPVVMWPARSVYEQLVPEGSFIHTDDFPSARDLAWHLDNIYKDDAVFNKYLSWQGTGLFVKSWYCRLCALLHHNNLPDLMIEDINLWWNPEGECTS